MGLVLTLRLSLILLNILDEYKKIIDADLPIEKGYLNKAKEIRFYRLPNIAMIPCGGTHVY